MTRDARLYLLDYKDWKPLREIFDENKNHNLKHFVTIFQLMTSTSKDQYYAIISTHETVDTILEEYGCKEAVKNDHLRITLHDYNGEPLYGDKSNLVFLNKI